MGLFWVVLVPTIGLSLLRRLQVDRSVLVVGPWSISVEIVDPGAFWSVFVFFPMFVLEGGVWGGWLWGVYRWGLYTFKCWLSYSGSTLISTNSSIPMSAR